MAQSAQSLYDGLRQGGLVVVRKTPQDYRSPLLFLVRLLRNIVWADVIHVQTANIITSLTNAIVPAVLGERLGKSCIISYKGGYPEEFLARYDSILRRFLRKAKILVTTEWMANCFRRYGYESFVIPNVVEVEAFLKVKHERGSQRLIVCRHLDRRYNIPMALRAFKIIKRKFPRATLTVVGDGPMRNELGLLSNELSLADVRFQPSVPHLELPKIYAKADLFLNPTNAVGIPISLVEAAAAGLVVISIDSGGIREFIQEESTGFLSLMTIGEQWRNWRISHFENQASLRNWATLRNALQHVIHGGNWVSGSTHCTIESQPKSQGGRKNSCRGGPCVQGGA